MLFTVCIGMALAFAACSTEDSTEQESEKVAMKTLTFTGGYDEVANAKASTGDTRMGVNYTTKLFYWEAGDFITVWASTDGTNYTAYTSSQLSSDFTNNAKATFTVEVPANATSYYVTYNSQAVYTDGTPTSATYKNSLKVTIKPSTQGTAYGTDADVNGDNLPILAQCSVTNNTDGNLSFKLIHQLAYVYVKIWNWNNESSSLGNISGCDGMSITYDGTATYNTTTFKNSYMTVGDVYAIVPTKDVSFKYGENTNEGVSITGNGVKRAYFYTLRNNYTSDLIIGDYFQWDAIDIFTSDTPNSAFGTGTEATQTWCKGCPSPDECLEIIKYPHYWDDGSEYTTNPSAYPQMSYTMGDGNVTHKGVWIVKPSARGNYTTSGSPVLNGHNEYTGTVSGTSGTNITIRANADFVFLPAAGYYTKNENSEDILNDGNYSCNYWTNMHVDTYGYGFEATSSDIGIFSKFTRADGFLSWQFPNAQ